MAEKKQKIPGKNGFKYREQYGVIVICKDEKSQEALFNNLKNQGHKCRVVTV
jgi:predicted 3-demethylubiquinone-9 3-methyltransferase (glyoxalase superfamily)